VRVTGSASPLEELHGPLVFFSRRPALESTEVSALACLGIGFSRIEAIFARL